MCILICYVDMLPLALMNHNSRVFPLYTFHKITIMCFMWYLNVQGIDKYVVADTEEANNNKLLYPQPLNVIEGPLMKVEYFLIVS